MYGEDKTTLDELTKTITDLEGLKIEIIEKADKTSELNSAIEKMENQIKQADDKILNDTHFVATGNETATDNEQNVTDEQTTNETNTQTEITISKDSNVNILIDNINTLVNKVNEQVKAETERKAEEERKAKEEAEKKSYVGTYKNNQGNTVTITMKDNGDLYYNFFGYSKKINTEKKNKDGAIIVEQITGYGMAGTYIYPAGIKISIVTLGTFDNNGNWVNSKVDNTKIRIVDLGSAEPDISGCFYKVD